MTHTVTLFNLNLKLSCEDDVLKIYKLISDKFNEDNQPTILNEVNYKIIKSKIVDFLNEIQWKDINVDFLDESSIQNTMMSNPMVFPLYEDILRVWDKVNQKCNPIIEALSVGYVKLGMNKDTYFDIVDHMLKMNNDIFLFIMSNLYYGEKVEQDLLCKLLKIKKYNKHDNDTTVFQFDYTYNGMNVYYIYNRQNSPFTPFELYHMVSVIGRGLSNEDLEIEDFNLNNNVFTDIFYIRRLRSHLQKKTNMFIKDNQFIELTFEDGNGKLLGEEDYNFDFVQGSDLVCGLVERQSLLGITPKINKMWELV